MLVIVFFLGRLASGFRSFEGRPLFLLCDVSDTDLLYLCSNGFFVGCLAIKLDAQHARRRRCGFQHTGDLSHSRLDRAGPAGVHRLRLQLQVPEPFGKRHPGSLGQFPNLSNRNLIGIKVDTDLPLRLPEHVGDVCISNSIFCFEQVDESLDARITTIRNFRQQQAKF